MELWNNWMTWQVSWQISRKRNEKKKKERETHKTHEVTAKRWQKLKQLSNDGQPGGKETGKSQACYSESWMQTWESQQVNSIYVLQNVTERNEEVTFKEKTEKKAKTKTLKCGEDLKLQFEMPLQIPEKTDKVNFKISSEKVNSTARRKKSHGNMKSPLEFSILTVVGQFA